jgi:hypothetical protein
MPRKTETLSGWDVAVIEEAMRSYAYCGGEEATRKYAALIEKIGRTRKLKIEYA